jgi:hypothetical protein
MKNRNCALRTGLEATLERIKAGVPIPPIEPSQIERVWEGLSRIRRETLPNVTVGLTAACGNPEFAPKNPVEQIALSVRYRAQLTSSAIT